MMRYKCFNCKKIIKEDALNEEHNCPLCNDPVEQMCPNDHCNCPHDIAESIAYCELCGAPICPECKCHDVHQLSRITGYMSDVAGWNAAKRQELKDRRRQEV
jgi:hypothetical protein